jgi:hypothetical protein
MAKVARDHPGSAAARWVRNAQSEQRARLAQEYPGADVDELLGQQAFLDCIEDVRRADPGLTYADAMRRAADEHPEDYASYEAACGRRG